MIKLHGTNLSKEYAAAAALRDLIVREWPDIESSSHESIDIVPSAKLFGQIKSDVDIIVFGNVNCSLELNQNGTTERFIIRNFCMAIEAKGHSEDKVRLVGNLVEVPYYSKYLKKVEWHPASEQSHDQGVSLGNYLRNNGCKGLFVNNLIWLTNYPSRLLPSTEHNILGRDSSWEDFLACVCRSARVLGQRNGICTIQASNGDATIREAAQIFTRSITSTPLDRKRMERVSRTFVKDKPQQYVERFGEIIVVFKGRGGTGKTMRLIQLAHYLYEDEGARVLFLTYNKALVADIRRLFSLMNISSNRIEKSIRVMTVHRYVRELLVAFDIMPEDRGDFLEKYDQYKAKLLDMIGGATRDVLENLLGPSKSALFWDFTLVDEAQDWPEDERDILFAVQSYKHVIIADGIDQLVRSHSPTDWFQPFGVRKKVEYEKTVTLTKSLRLKSRLCTFVNDFSESIGANWKLQPLHDVFGGKVIIIEGSWKAYAENETFHESLLAGLRSDGNFNVDALFCVHPHLCGWADDSKYAFPATVFNRWGYQCWDGVAADIRDSCPTSPEQLRIVQYDSCRGLEGWLVVNFEIDEFYDYKVNTYVPTPAEEEDIFFDKTEFAQHHAEQWLLIPMSRAIDTLVLQVKKKNHAITKALSDVASRYPDLVEWRKI